MTLLHYTQVFYFFYFKKTLHTSEFNTKYDTENHV